MKFVTTPLCDICGRSRGGKGAGKIDHSKCSKIRQRQGGVNRTNGKRHLGDHEIKYLVKTGSK